MERLRTWFGIALRTAVLLAGLSLTLAPAAAETRAPGPRPAIWLLADEDTKIYLFGTLHILPRDIEWRSPALERVIEESDELVMELDEGEAQEAALTLLHRMMLGKEVPLVQRVSPERRPILRRMLAETGMPAESFDGLQTWAAALALGAAHAARRATGSRRRQDWTGVEEVLNVEFLRRERPVSGIETPDQQLGFFSRLPQSVQRKLLEQTIDAFATEESPTDPDESDWTSGDVEAIGRMMEEMPPELFGVLLTDRNRQWTDWLIERLDRPGSVLFAVGAGHLAGRDSVQSMLEARGLTVVRID